jgi:hypothetical protein
MGCFLYPSTRLRQHIAVARKAGMTAACTSSWRAILRYSASRCGPGGMPWLASYQRQLRVLVAAVVVLADIPP